MINLSLNIPSYGVIAFKNHQEVYSHFEGLRNIEKNLPMTRDTKLRVASVSKMFTMFSIMQLVEQGKLNLDEDVSKYLGFKLRNPNFDNQPITIRMLASHTSTLRDGLIYSLPPQYSINEFFKPNGIAYDNGIHFADKDKSFFTYCNLNYGILATIIECLTGERFDLFQKNHLFNQLNINADYVIGNLDFKSFSNLGTIYQKNLPQIDNYPSQPEPDTVLIQNPYARSTDTEYSLKNYKIGTNATIFSPQGGLRISFDELAIVMKIILNGGNQIIKSKSLNEMCRSQWIFNDKFVNGDTYEVMFNYGLGLYRIIGNGKARLCKDYNIDFIGHSGEAYGLISGFYFTADFKNGILFMINGTNFELGSDESLGKFSNNYIYEEEIINPVCNFLMR